MKKTIILAALLFAGFLFAQDNPPKLNGVIWNPDGIELTYVEGSGDIKGFFIGSYEITQAQWQAVMGSNPSNHKGDDLPVEYVGWNDAKEFLKKLNAQTGRNYRLPTEGEWRYAAKGGNISQRYEYAGSNNIDEVAWYKDNSRGLTHPVGRKKPNELGIFDMSGNVWEWCEDCYSNNCSTRVNLGGGRISLSYYMRVANRESIDNKPDDYSGNLGFRIVLP